MKRRAIPTAEVLNYPHPDGDILVTHLGPKDVRETTVRQIMWLMGEAYANEFEKRDLDTIADGTMRHHFDTEDPVRVAQQQARMEAHIKNGSSYWLALQQPDGAAPEMLALAKVSPSYPSLAHRLGRKMPELYIDDVVASPERDNREARRGLGSLVLHSALVYAGYESTAHVTADSYQDSRSSQAFFAAHGFELQESIIPEPTTLRGLDGPLNMAMTRFEAPSLDEVVHELEENKPWLAEAQVIR